MSTTTKKRIASQVRQAATDQGVTRADLRRALDITDWRTIQARWDGETAYTTDELGILAEMLRITFHIPDSE